jgi:hypothetical protein
MQIRSMKFEDLAKRFFPTRALKPKKCFGDGNGHFWLPSGAIVFGKLKFSFLQQKACRFN